jgi:N-acetyl-gamma-glutamyl-phosphate reductase
MIKVGITGCDNLRAAELVRLLINHPDVELRWVTSRVDAGERLDRIVPGILGECDLTASSPDRSCDEVDLVFMCDRRECVPDVLKGLALTGNTRVVDLSGCHNLAHGIETPWKYGLSEMQRRMLVHETQQVTMPGNAAMASLLALMPMARNLLLNSPLTLHVAMGATAFPENGKTIDGFTPEEWAADQQREVVYALNQCQSSFSQPVTLTVTPLGESRTLGVAVRFKCNVDGETVRQLYDQYYDDHNFVFIVDRPIITADVENTNKCLISLDKDDRNGLLTVHAVMDVLLKGCAGNAVHIMNLMFGLQERVGLALKGTGC